jgi:hypothetical protein
MISSVVLDLLSSSKVVIKDPRTAFFEKRKKLSGATFSEMRGWKGLQTHMGDGLLWPLMNSGGGVHWGGCTVSVFKSLSGHRGGTLFAKQDQEIILVLSSRR